MGGIMKDSDKLTVCAECHRACCWQGAFMCDDAQTAGTVTKTIMELRKMNLGESEHYWIEGLEYE